MDRPSRQRINKKTVDLNTVEKMRLANIHKTFYPRTADIHSTQG